MPRASVDVGTTIADTYTLEALLGRGGMGSVFLASHARLPGKRVAIKLLHVELTDADVIARFRREALIASQLEHPNIVRVDDYNLTPDGTPYLVLEYLEGESLAERLTRGPLPLEHVMSIVRMVGSAVAAAHREGIVHRDLKPQNIFLVPTEIDGHLHEIAKVLDFGISKMRGSDTIKTHENTLLGTPQYMAPEQATGRHADVDERTDVFALGAITYEMLTGRPAFTGENIPEVVFKVVYEPPPALAAAAPHVPTHVVAAVERAMQKQAGDRFVTVSEFVEALTGRPLAAKASLSSLPPRVRTPADGGRTVGLANTVDSGNLQASPHAETVASQPGAPVARTPPRSGPRPLVVALALACLAALVAVIVVVATRREEARAPAPDAALAVAVIHDAVAHDAAILVDGPPLAVDVAPDAAVIDASADGAKHRKPPGTARATGDPAAARDLAAAQAAYAAGDVDRATQLANNVIGSAVASQAQIDAALLVRGTIHCKHEHDLGLTRATYRQIESRAVQAQLARRCGL